MQATEFILETLSHFVRGDDGPPPGIPTHVASAFEQELTWLCEWHSVTAIVLSSLGDLALPPRLSRLTQERMKALAVATATLSKERLAAADALTAGLHERGVEVLLMRDIVYPRSVYPATGLRPVEVLEMLIKEADYSAVLQVCEGVGFSRGPRTPEFERGADAMHFHQHYGPCVLGSDKGDHLRLRFRLFDVGAPEPVEASWRRSVLPGEGGPRELSIEDQLIASCMTYNMTHFDKLLYAVDIGLILTRRELNWNYVRERLRSRSAYAAGFFSLQHAARALKLGPQAVKLKSPSLIRRNLFFFAWSGADTDLVAGRILPNHRLRYCFLEMDGWPERLRFIASLLFPKPQWVAAFFGRPYTPWRRIKFVVLALRNRVGAR